MCVCVLYVTLSMRISVHNKSPELFTVKLESHCRRRVRHWALEQKVRDRYTRRRFNSPCLHSLLSSPLFFLFLFSPSVFLPLGGLVSCVLPEEVRHASRNADSAYLCAIQKGYAESAFVMHVVPPLVSFSTPPPFISEPHI